MKELCTQKSLKMALKWPMKDDEYNTIRHKVCWLNISVTHKGGKGTFFKEMYLDGQSDLITTPVPSDNYEIADDNDVAMPLRKSERK